MIDDDGNDRSRHTPKLAPKQAHEPKPERAEPGTLEHSK